MTWHADLAASSRGQQTRDELLKDLGSVASQSVGEPIVGLLALAVPTADLDSQIVFWHEETGHKYLASSGRPINRLSVLNPSDTSHVCYLLGLKPKEVLRALTISYQVHMVAAGGDEGSPDVLATALCNFMIERGFGNSAWAPFSIYFDLPTVECYAWARKFEQTLTGLFPSVKFQNRLGRCNKCEAQLQLKEHDQGYAWDEFLCEPCFHATVNARRSQKKPSRERVSFVCRWCGKVRSVLASLFEREQPPVYCSIQCSGVDHEKKVGIHCAFCGRESKRQAGELKRHKLLFCNMLCYASYQSLYLGKKIRIYTPSLLKDLQEYDGFKGEMVCAFPGCEEQQASSGRMNPWHVCHEHQSRIYAALKSRERDRKKKLKSHGL